MKPNEPIPEWSPETSRETSRETNGNDPLLAKLRGLRRDELDDVTSSRALLEAEAAFQAAASVPRPRRLARSIGLVPAGLALWGALYVWCALGELRRLYPSDGARSELGAAAAIQGPARLASATSTAAKETSTQAMRASVQAVNRSSSGPSSAGSGGAEPTRHISGAACVVKTNTMTDAAADKASIRRARRGARVRHAISHAVHVSSAPPTPKTV